MGTQLREKYREYIHMNNYALSWLFTSILPRCVVIKAQNASYVYWTVHHLDS